MHRFQNVEPDPDRVAVLALDDAIRVAPMYALTDERTPTVCLVSALKTRGWRPVSQRVVHTEVLQAGGIANFDGRGAVKQKYYYLVLLQLEQCLPRAGGSVPSGEIGFPEDGALKGPWLEKMAMPFFFERDSQSHPFNPP